MTNNDLVPLDPHTFGEQQMCFGCGPNNRTGMGLKFFRDGDEVVTTFRAKEGWEGPPGIVHGGLQATLADEVGAWTLVGLRNRFGFTASMQLRYYRPARMTDEVEARGSIVEETDRMAVVKVTLRQDGKRIVSGKISYVTPTQKMAEKMLGFELPEEWASMTRAEED